MPGPERRKTRVLIVEDEAILRDVLTRLLSALREFEVVGAAGSLRDSQATLRESSADLVLLDVNLPDGCGIEWARTVRGEHPDMRIVFLSACQDDEIVMAAIGTGAEGYLGKTASCQLLVSSLRSVVAGGCAYDPAAIGRVVRRAGVGALRADAQWKESQELRALSAREREIAELVCRGLTNEEIAEAAYVSLNTVKTHMRRIFQRLGVSSRRELARRLESMSTSASFTHQG